MLVALLAGRGARVRRRVGGGRARRARGANAAATINRAVEAVSVDLKNTAERIEEIVGNSVKPSFPRYGL